MSNGLERVREVSEPVPKCGVRTARLAKNLKSFKLLETINFNLANDIYLMERRSNRNELLAGRFQFLDSSANIRTGNEFGEKS